MAAAFWRERPARGTPAGSQFGAGGQLRERNRSMIGTRGSPASRSCFCTRSSSPPHSAPEPRRARPRPKRARAGFPIIKTKPAPGSVALGGAGAGGGTRTHTVSPPTDFESVTSTIPSHRHAVRLIPQRAHRAEPIQIMIPCPPGDCKGNFSAPAPSKSCRSTPRTPAPPGSPHPKPPATSRDPAIPENPKRSATQTEEEVV